MDHKFAEIRQLLILLGLGYWTEDEGHAIVLEARDGLRWTGELTDGGNLLWIRDSSYHPETMQTIRVESDEHDECLDDMDFEEATMTEIATFIIQWVDVDAAYLMEYAADPQTPQIVLDAIEVALEDKR